MTSSDNEMPQSVVFVDSQITDYQAIVAAIDPGVKVIVYDGTQDGLAQIAQDLQGVYDLASVDIISHGAADEVQVGTDTLTTSTIPEYAADLAAIGNALAPNGQLDLYGCDVAAGGDGFLTALQQATGRNVAASTDPIGATLLGGTWTLDATTGPAPDALPANSAALQSFDGLLLTTPAQIYFDTWNGSGGGVIGQGNMVEQVTANGGTLVSSNTIINDGSPINPNGPDSDPYPALTYTTGFVVDAALGKYFIASYNGTDFTWTIQEGSLSGGGLTTLYTDPLPALNANDTPSGQPIVGTAVLLGGLALDTANGELYFARDAENYQSGDTIAADTGIYEVSVAGGPATLVTSTSAGLTNPLYLTLDTAANLVFFDDAIVASDGFPAVENLDVANLTTGAVTVLKSFNTIDPNSFDLQGLAIDTANSTLYLTARDFNTSSDNAIYSIPFSVSGSGSTATASVGATTTLYSGAGAFQPTDIVVDAQAGIFYTSGTSPYTSPPNVDDQSGNEAGVFEGSLTGGLTLNEVFAVSSVLPTPTQATGDAILDTYSPRLFLADIAPVVTAGATATFDGGGSAVTLDSGLTVEAGSSATLASATVTLSSGELSSDILSFNGGTNTETFLDGDEITATYSAGVLTLSGTAEVADYQTALDQVQFSTTGPADPTNGGSDTSRTISWVANDGTSNSTAVTSTLDTVHVAPTVTAGASVNDVSGGSAVVLDSALTVTNVDSGGNLTGAKVSIVSPLTGDTLSFTAQNNITESSYTNGMLTLTGTATVQQYEAALESITFGTTSTTAGDRTIDWQVSDGSSSNGTSATTTSTVDVVVPPVIGGTGNTVQFLQSQGSTGTPLDGGLTLTDGVDIASATVTISTGFHSGDTLGFENGSATQTFSDSATVTASQSGNVLTLTTTAGNATAADYQKALESVTYSFSGDPTIGGTDRTRTITWSVTDANGLTSVPGSTSTLDVYMTPVLAGTVSPTPTVTATSGAVTADFSLTITDDNTIGTTPVATVTITSGSQAGDELIIPAGDLTTGKITGTTITVSNNDTAALTLTGTSTTTDAQFQSALRDVEFDATSPHSGTRQLTWLLNDDAGNNPNDSNSFTTNVDATFGPELTGGQNFSETEGTSTGSLQLVTFTDSEITSPTTGNFTATIDWGDGTALDTTGTIADLGGGTFAVDGVHIYAEEKATPDLITVTVKDTGGVSGSATDSATIADAPLSNATAVAISGTEGAPLTAAVATFTDTNPDGTVGDFTAGTTINWGDGTAATSATITESGGVFTVSGTHTYTEEGSYTPIVTIVDDGGSTTTATSPDSATIADAALSNATAAAISGTEGAPLTVAVATFTDTNPDGTVGDFTAGTTINWGDGTAATSATITESGGVFTVSGTHTYTEEGSYTPVVTIVDDGGQTATATDSATIADAPLSNATAVAISGTEGAPLTAAVATFTDTNPDGTVGDFTAGTTINWGDGTAATSATITESGGVFTVSGTHTYTEEGSYTPIVTIVDDGGSTTTATSPDSATIADAALSNATAVAISGTEGAPLTAAVATFTDTNPDGTVGDFTAGTTINWGDGTAATSATITESGGVFTVSGTHTYTEEGSYTPVVTIVDDGGQTATATSSNSATIADAPLTGSGVTENGTQDVSLTAPVATFTDANPDGSVSDFTATVIWGDGTAATSATITESGGVFTVTGTHTYTVQGTYMPTVSIVDDGGSTATVTDTFDIVHAPPTVTAGGTATYIGAGAVTLDAGVTVSDPDSGGDLAGATVTISTGFIAGDTLEIGGQTSGTITDTGGTINYAFTGSTLSLSGLDTLADYQAALDSITYSFTPSNGDATKGGTDTSRTISWTVNDGAPSNGTGTAASTLLVPTTPVVTAAHAVVPASASESFTAAQLFSASDPAGAPILTYKVEDESGGSSQGFWVLNGAVLPNGQITTLTAAQLSQLSFVAGSASTPVLDTLEVAASDAAGFGAFTTFTVTAAAHAPTTPPTVTAANELQAPNLALAGSSLFSGTAFGGNTITSYEVEDTTTDSGHWVFNGTVEPTNQIIDVTVAQLAQLSFDTSYGSDTLMVRANDGTQWGSFTSFTVTPPPNAAPPAGTADTLVMLRNADGAFEFYDIGRNTVLLDGPLGQITPVLQVAGVGGFNGADAADLLMRDPTTGVFTLYDVSNNNITGNVVVGQVGLEWTVSGLGDFSTRANETDMLMRNSNTGQFEVYDIANNAITFAGPMGQVGLEWSIAGFGDFSTRANETDMLMRNSNTGAFEVYDIANNAITFAGPMGQVGLEWSIAGFGDFSTRANETDMLMRNSNTGAFEVYDIANNTITFAGPMGQVGLEWTVAGFGDFSGNANETDMLMRNSNTGAFELYDINNNTIAGTASMGQVGLEWSIGGVSATPAAAPPTTLLTQAMASFAPDTGTLTASSPLEQTMAPAAISTTLLTTNHA